ncbi:MAG: transferase [Desulfobacteraceae bacterium]|nr:transferase [Desulfobacteraceae bacterium]
MKNIKQLNEQIVSRANANLREFNFDTGIFLSNAIKYKNLAKFYSYYGITAHHPINFNFRHSCMAGSYFLGDCFVGESVVYRSDVRGDELKRKGDILDKKNPLPLLRDETIAITYSLLYKTLVHSNSHNPETPEEFTIKNTVAAHYSNIHGATITGSFLGAFATVDLMNLHSCIIGEFSYVQTGELFHKKVEPGTTWIKSDDFEFKYKLPESAVDKYIGVNESFQPKGIIYQFVRDLEREAGKMKMSEFGKAHPIGIPESSAVNTFSILKGDIKIGENVLVSQKAYLDNAQMGEGANAQENSYIINSKLEGFNVTAHGGKIINSDMGTNIFVGFNSFLYGKEDARLSVGKGCVIMPHTIIDITNPLSIPENHLVWGFIQSEEDLKTNSISLDEFSKSKDTLEVGGMTFTGNGAEFINAFSDRIGHILEGNGAYFDGTNKRGHAQDGKNISFNTIQPYKAGDNEGIYPSISIKP